MQLSQLVCLSPNPAPKVGLPRSRKDSVYIYITGNPISRLNLVPSPQICGAMDCHAVILLKFSLKYLT